MNKAIIMRVNPDRKVKGKTAKPNVSSAQLDATRITALVVAFISVFAFFFKILFF